MKRSEKIVTHLEPIVFSAAKQVINREKLSDSAYVRKAVIRDLIDRGLLTKEIVADLLC